MRHRPWLYTTLALAVAALASCGEETTEPSTELSPNAPTLAVAHDTWIYRRNMPYGRWDFSVADVPNALGQSVVYVMGGSTRYFTAALGRVQAYNVATNTWSWKAEMPMPLYKMNGAGVIDGKIYISGGYRSGDRVDRGLFVYDPETDKWTQKSNMPERGALGLTGVIDNKLYVVSTCFDRAPSSTRFVDCETLKNGRPLSNLFRYDPATDQWTTLPSPRDRYSVGAAGVLYGKLYVSNGIHLEVYDPATNRWTTKAAPPPYSVGAGAALGAKLYVIGWSTTTVYNPGTDSWTFRTRCRVTEPSLPRPASSSRGVLESKCLAAAGLARICSTSHNSSGPLPGLTGNLGEPFFMKPPDR